MAKPRVHEIAAELGIESKTVLEKLKDMGEEDNTIVVFTTDNGTESFTWPASRASPCRCKFGPLPGAGSEGYFGSTSLGSIGSAKIRFRESTMR